MKPFDYIETFSGPDGHRALQKQLGKYWFDQIKLKFPLDYSPDKSITIAGIQNQYLPDQLVAIGDNPDQAVAKLMESLVTSLKPIVKAAEAYLKKNP